MILRQMMICGCPIRCLKLRVKSGCMSVASPRTISTTWATPVFTVLLMGFSTGIAAAETEDEVLQKMEERNDTRKNKEYEKSDVSRKDLAAVGITIMDSPDGTSWRPAIPLALQEQLTGS